MAEQIPYYSKNLQDSLNGMYGHNIIDSGDSAVVGRVFSSITATAGCTVSYTKYTGIESNGDDTVTSLNLNAGTKINTGAITIVSVGGIGGRAFLTILEL